MTPVHLDADTVASLLDPAALVDEMAKIFAELGRGTAASTVRVRAATEEAMASAMAAAIPSHGVTGGKLYATVDGRFTFHVVLFDLDGQVLCTMDGGPLTEARTAALSGAVLRKLGHRARPVAAIFGTGREALPHIAMLHDVAGPSEVRLWGRSPAAASEVAAAAAAVGHRVEVVGNANEAATGADILITVTSANDPIVDDTSIAEHAIVCAVGATKSYRCELPPTLFKRAGLVVSDSAVGARTECGDLIRAVDQGHFDWDDLHDVTELFVGTLPTDTANGPIIFETQGVAIQDVAAAAQVYRAFAHQ